MSRQTRHGRRLRVSVWRSPSSMVARGDTGSSSTSLDERPASVPDAAAYRRSTCAHSRTGTRRGVGARGGGGLDLLVNNAGVATGGRIDVESIAGRSGLLDINLLGVARGCHTFTPSSRRSAAGTSSTSRPSPASSTAGHGEYNATKAGVAISETLLFEPPPLGHRRLGRLPASSTNLHESFAGKDTEM